MRNKFLIVINEGLQLLRSIIKVKQYVHLPKLNVNLEAIQSQRNGFKTQLLLLDLIDQELNEEGVRELILNINELAKRSLKQKKMKEK